MVNKRFNGRRAFGAYPHSSERGYQALTGHNQATGLAGGYDSFCTILGFTQNLGQSQMLFSKRRTALMKNQKYPPFFDSRYKNRANLSIYFVFSGGFLHLIYFAVLCGFF